MQEDNDLLGFRVLQEALIFLNPSFFFPSHTCTYRVCQFFSFNTSHEQTIRKCSQLLPVYASRLRNSHRGDDVPPWQETRHDICRQAWLSVSSQQYWEPLLPLFRTFQRWDFRSKTWELTCLGTEPGIRIDRFLRRSKVVKFWRFETLIEFILYERLRKLLIATTCVKSFHSLLFNARCLQSYR